MATVTTNHEKYSRLALMLVKGGTKTTRALFENRYKAMTPKDHIPFPWTLDEFLQAKKDKILSYQTGKNKQWVFFPEASGTNIDNWDLSMFCFVLVDVCEVSRTIRMDVDQLKKMRNKLSHLSEPSVDNGVYERYIDKIEVIFDRLLVEIDDQVLKAEIANVRQAAMEGPLCLQDTLNVMHKFYSMEGVTQTILSQQSEDIKEVKETVREIAKTLHLKNEITKERESVIVPETIIELLVKNCVSDKETFISNMLVDMFKEAIGSSTADELLTEEYSKIREAVRKIVEKFIPKDRMIVEAESKCVMLRIRCTSVASLLSLFDDCIDGNLNKEFTQLEARIREIIGYENLTVEAVMFEDEFWKTIRKTVSSLHEITSRLDNTTYQSSTGRQIREMSRISDVNLVKRISPSIEDERRIQHAVRIKIQTDQDSKEKLNESVKNGFFESSINRLRDEIVYKYNLNKLSIEARVFNEESPTQADAVLALFQHCKEDNEDEVAHVSGQKNAGAISEPEDKTENIHQYVCRDFDMAKHTSPFEDQSNYSIPSFVVENEGFFNWTGCVFALRDTKNALQGYVKKTTKQHLETWPRNERLNIKQFISHNYSWSYGTVLQLYRLKCNCEDCTAIYKRLTALKSFPDKPLHLGNPSLFSKSWWILLRMYLPQNSCNKFSLEECDVASICDLIESCQLFDDMDNENLKQIKCFRDKLMHSSSNEISEEQKNKFFEELMSMCENPLLRNRMEFQDCMTKLKYAKVILHRFNSTLPEFENIREAFKIQENAINHDLEECREIKECQYARSDLEKLLEHVKENKATVIDVIGVKGKLVGTLKQATAIGLSDAGQLLPAFVGTTVGCLTGGAGANVAGRYKMRRDNNN